jgi:hypothetical protein
VTSSTIAKVGFGVLLLAGCGNPFDEQCSIAGPWTLVQTYTGATGGDCPNLPAVGTTLTDTLTITDGPSAGTFSWTRSNQNQTTTGTGTVDDSCAVAFTEVAPPRTCTFTDSPDGCSLATSLTFHLKFTGTSASGMETFNLTYTDTTQGTTGSCTQIYSASLTAL